MGLAVSSVINPVNYKNCRQMNRNGPPKRSEITFFLSLPSNPTSLLIATSTNRVLIRIPQKYMNLIMHADTWFLHIYVLVDPKNSLNTTVNIFMIF